VILARTDLNPRSFQWSNPQSGQFAAYVPFTTPNGTIPITRSWASVDVHFHGSTFRFIGTHLESFVPIVREAQGAELRAGPGNTSLPVIVAMDSNAQAFPLPQDPTYSDFMAAGYSDVWQELFPSAPGLTCCQSESDNNPVSQLYQRIDLILTLGNIEEQNIGLFGADPSTRTPDGLWPSDHAGVAAQVTVESD
jgi:endonuclease/exonuclease/phosphatase family metal-dependent hydrolase